MAKVKPSVSDLISWWPLDEDSGNALDVHGTNELTETGGTIGTAAGKVGQARDIELGDNEYLGIADTASLSFGDEDFTLTGWFKTESQVGNMRMAGKWDTGVVEYLLLYNATDRFQFYVSNNGVASTVVNADNFGAVPNDTWIFIICRHDAVANTITIQVNNGVPNSVEHATGCNDNVSVFALGSSESGDYDGLFDEVNVWGAVLTADEGEWLYNSVNGRAYSELAISTGNFFNFF